jgi:hypothetical protein
LKIWQKGKLKCEKIWIIWKNGKLNNEKIWKIWKQVSSILIRYEKYARNPSWIVKRLENTEEKQVE